MFALKPASAEQLAIVDALGDSNLIVDAVAGSGKTTCVCFIAQRYNHSRILLLTYNSRLRAETQERLSALVLDHVSCHTYHSFAYRYVGPSCATDAGIIEFARNGSRWTDPIPRFDIVIIDEAQDQTPLLFLITCAILRDNSARVCVMGDRYQAIYSYSGSDYRFLTKADQLFSRYVDGPWRRMQLTTSYRITHSMADFVNLCIPTRGIRAVKDGPKVTYADMDIQEPAQIIWKLLQDGVPPDDIYVISPSVRSQRPQTPIRLCANELTRRRVPIFVPTDDETRPTKDVLQGKVVFSSFHQSKGLERKYVLVFGADRNYYRFYAKGSSEQICENTLYVAFTRASHQLFVMIRGDQPLAFLRGKNEQEQLKLEQSANLHIRDHHRRALSAPLTAMEIMVPESGFSVTTLVRHVPSVVLDACMRRIQVVSIREPDELIEIPNVVRQGTTKEEVSAISGVATVSWYEFVTTGKISWCPTTEIDLTPENILKLSTIYIGQREKLRFRAAQIRNYDWITEDIFRRVSDRLINEIAGDVIQTEVPLARNVIINGQPYTISGSIDIAVNNRIIEIKTTAQLSAENVLQLMLYRWQMCSDHAARADLNHGDQYVYQLYNVRTNEMREITATQHDLDWIVKLLMCKRLHQEAAFDDDEFVHAVSGLGDAQPCQICMRAQL